MKKVIENFEYFDGRRCCFVDCYEQRPMRRMITIDFKYYPTLSSEPRSLRQRFFLPLPYVYCLRNRDTDYPRFFFTKQSITEGWTPLYCANILPNTDVLGMVCFGGNVTTVDNYWNVPFCIKPGDGFPIEGHIVSWVRTERKKPVRLEYIDWFHSCLCKKDPSRFSTKWEVNFKTEFSFESWQNLTDEEFSRVRFDDFENTFVKGVLSRWWNEEDHR